jgi:hypothetical protein
VAQRLATLAADFSHMPSITADRFAATSSGVDGLFMVELMGRTALMSRPPTHSGDFPLLLGVHRREATLTLVCHQTILLGEGVGLE